MRRLHPPQIQLPKSCRITLSLYVASQIAKRCASLAAQGARQMVEDSANDPFGTLTKLHDETVEVLDHLTDSLQQQLDAYIAALSILNGEDETPASNPHPVIDMAMVIRQSREELAIAEPDHDDSQDVDFLAVLDEVIEVLQAEMESTRNREGKTNTLLRKAVGHALTIGIDGRRILDRFDPPENWTLPDNGNPTAAAMRCVADDADRLRRHEAIHLAITAALQQHLDELLHKRSRHLTPALSGRRGGCSSRRFRA